MLREIPRSGALGSGSSGGGGSGRIEGYNDADRRRREGACGGGRTDARAVANEVRLQGRQDSCQR